MDTPHKLSHYLAHHQQIQGWMQPDLIPAARTLDEFQQASGIKGGVAEIGVHHGRFFLLLHNLLRDGEQSFAMDLFENQQDNIDFSGKGSMQAFLDNLAEYGEAPERCKPIACDSLAMSARDLFKAGVRGIRLFSIDGGHTAEHTVNDMRLAEDAMAPGGVIFVDDYYNPHWPGVHIGVNRYYTLGTPRFVPFAYRRDKLLLCSLTWHKRYFNLFVQKFSKDNKLFKTVTMFGYPVVVS